MNLNLFKHPSTCTYKKSWMKNRQHFILNRQLLSCEKIGFRNFSNLNVIKVTLWAISNNCHCRIDQSYRLFVMMSKTLYCHMFT